MKLVYVITRSDSIGGAHVHVRDLCLALLRHGHDVTVLVGGSGPFCDELRVRHIPFLSIDSLVRELNPRRDIAATKNLFRVLGKLNPDLVATHSSKAGWIGRIVARMLRIPVTFTAHGWAFTEGVSPKAARLYRLAERCTGFLADRVIAVSRYDRELAIRNRIVPPNKILTIHNGIPDIPVTALADPERHPPRLVMVARFEAPKDHRTVVEALARLTDRDWTLDLIGDGPLRRETEQLVARLGLGSRIRFLGVRKDVHQQLAQAQVFVLISNWEGFPLSILEAMRAGLPVVASNVGGVSEAVFHGETGFTVPRGDIMTLRKYLEELITRPHLRLALGRRGRQVFEERFRFERMLDKTLNVYYQVLAERRGAAHR